MTRAYLSRLLRRQTLSGIVVSELEQWRVGDEEVEQRVLELEVQLVFSSIASTLVIRNESNLTQIPTDVNSLPGSPKFERHAMSSLPSGMTVLGAGLDGKDGITDGVSVYTYWNVS